MTKTLLLLRHGKSDWDRDAGGDRQRPLAKRGKNAATAVGRFIAQADLIPDVVVTSPAVRTRETVALAADAGDWSRPVREDDTLYGAAVRDVIALLLAEPDTTERLMLVGHEPTWSETVATLVGGGAHRVPTGAVVRIDLDVASWSDVSPGVGRLIFLLPPRLLTD
jgi:phosphohistidine phosphatase